MARFVLAASVAVFIAAAAYGSGADEYLQVQAAIGVKTAACGGLYTISQVARKARASGIDAVITADAFLNRWEYGLWPLRNIVKKTETAASVSSYGIRRYLDDIDAATGANPGTIMIGGLETAPFYYWEGVPFSAHFAIRDWHKHLLVIGLERRNDIAHLPVMGNPAGPARPFTIRGILALLASVATVAAGYFSIREGNKAQEGVFEIRFGLPLGHWRYVGIAFIAAGLIIFINAYPFRSKKFDQYHGSRGTAPYQEMIDYVSARGGMTFWAHPETKNIERVGNVSIRTGEHADLLMETCGYSGFAIFYEGYDVVGKPRGVWDDLLRRYCKGGCGTPPWAIGVIDYEKDGDLDTYLANLRTVLLVKEKTRNGVIDAIKNGRMYVAKDALAAQFRLDRFTVGDASGKPAVMGEEAAVSGAPRIVIKGGFINAASDKGPLKVLLIRDGEALMAFDSGPALDITYDDTELKDPGRHYYRAEIRCSGLVLVTNPVFVTKRQEET